MAASHQTIDADTFVFPVHVDHTLRSYQASIVKRALTTNTLVSLPTGTGKTLIAAAVMLNYLDWFPTRLCIFMAPNRALVQQQVVACCAYIGLDPDVHAQLLTGEEVPAQRRVRWASSVARLIFCTPQTLYNDMLNGVCDPKRIACLVFDECHHARSEKESYAQVARYVREAQREAECAGARVLGLSATAGSSLTQVQSVINMLHVAAVETRTEKELHQFLHGRTIVVHRVQTAGGGGGRSGRPLSFRELLLMPAEPQARCLAQARVLTYANLGQLDAAVMSACREQLGRMQQSASRGLSMLGGASAARVEQLQGCQRLLESLVALADLAVDAGTPPPVEADGGAGGGGGGECGFDIGSDDGSDDGSAGDDVAGVAAKAAPAADPSRARQEQLEQQLRLVAECGMLSAEQLAEIRVHASSAAGAVGGGSIGKEWAKIAPKLTTLTSLLLAHFQQDASSRVIAFVNRRANVSALCAHLSAAAQQQAGPSARGLVRPAPFVGRSNRSDLRGAGGQGMGQAEQRQVIGEFRAGVHNVLVATSVAEEGLDIGEVDVVVFFDAVDSPIRLVQRLGRTGRKTSGQVLMLLSETEERRHNETVGLAERMSAAMDSGHGLELKRAAKPFLSFDGLKARYEKFGGDGAPRRTSAGGGGSGPSSVVGGPSAAGAAGDASAAAKGRSVAKENHSPHRQPLRVIPKTGTTAGRPTAAADGASSKRERAAVAPPKPPKLTDLTNLSDDSLSSEEGEETLAVQYKKKRHSPVWGPAAAAAKSPPRTAAASAAASTAKKTPSAHWSAAKPSEAKRAKAPPNQAGAAAAAAAVPATSGGGVRPAGSAAQPIDLSNHLGAHLGVHLGASTAPRPAKATPPTEPPTEPPPTLVPEPLPALAKPDELAALAEPPATETLAAAADEAVPPEGPPAGTDPRLLASPWSADVWLTEEQLDAWMSGGRAAVPGLAPVTSWRHQRLWPWG